VVCFDSPISSQISSKDLTIVAYIERVRSALDPNPMPLGLYQYSVVISTSKRETKITVPTKDRHDIWLNVSLLNLRTVHIPLRFLGFKIPALATEQYQPDISWDCDPAKSQYTDDGR
jgi:hypothetical protein